MNPDEAAELVKTHGGIRPAARASGLSFGKIWRALQRLQSPPPDGEFEEANRTEARLRDELRLAQRRLENLRREDDNAERIREKIYELAGNPPQPPEWLCSPTVRTTSGVPMTLWSDWHWGETVRREEVGGVNEFNSEIASQRAKLLTNKIISLSYDHMVNPDFPGIVVNLGGDMISGDIHEELQDTNDSYTLVTCLDLQDHLAAAISLVADHFGKVFLPSVVGNHGRTTLKSRFKGKVYTSYEWNIYCQLERYFRNDDRVQFLIPGESDAYYAVFDHRFCLTHGDTLGVKGGDGIIGAIGPIMRGSIKVGRLGAQIGNGFDTILMGHWHQYLSLPGIRVNGALKGYDEFARLALRAPYQRPIQSLWFMHEEYGLTAEWPIYLEALVSSTPRPWVSWPSV